MNASALAVWVAAKYRAVTQFGWRAMAWENVPFTDTPLWALIWEYSVMMMMWYTPDKLNLWGFFKKKKGRKTWFLFKQVQFSAAHQGISNSSLCHGQLVTVSALTHITHMQVLVLMVADLQRVILSTIFPQIVTREFFFFFYLNSRVHQAF